MCNFLSAEELKAPTKMNNFLCSQWSAGVFELIRFSVGGDS